MYLDNVVVMTCDHGSNDTNQIQNVKYLHIMDFIILSLLIDHYYKYTVIMWNLQWNNILSNWK